MERINNMVNTLLSFSLFPFGLVHSIDNFKEKLSDYQNTNQKTDGVNLYHDWQSVGNDIVQAMKKIKSEQ